LYDGNFLYGKRNGFGKMIYCDGDIYEGEWIDNEIKGKGIYSYKNGEKLDGVFLNGKENF
jgi:hypothetical protein